MAIAGIDPKCYILALFVRDDGVRFLLGDDPYEFKDKQLHFQPNTLANDVVEVQGNDGYLLAGQVRRPGTQSFDGYVCNGTNSKAEVEVKRREFLQFFRRSHFYKVIYVFPNGTAIQRKQGFLVDDPTVQELYQQYPEYHVALNFEDVNYYTYEEDDQGQEIYAKEAIVPLAGGGATGGLIWDEYGVVWEDPWSDPVSVSGSEMQIDNNAGAMAPIQDLELLGDTEQQTYSGKNIVPFPYNGGGNRNGITFTLNSDTSVTVNGKNNGNGNSSYNVYYKNPSTMTLPAGKYYFIPPSNTNIMYVIYTGSNYYDLDASNGYSVTFSSDTPIQQIYIQVRKGNTTTFNNVKVYPMLTTLSGQTESDFEPYVGGIPAPNPDYPQAVQTVTGEQTVTITDGQGQSQEYEVNLGNIELCKIGEYQDEIFNNDPNADWYDPDLEDNAWYVRKETGKYVFTGSESWGTAGEAGSGYYGYWWGLSGNGIDILRSNPNYYMTHLKWKDYSYNTRENCFMFAGATGSVPIIVVSNNSNFANVNSFKTWLSNNSVTLYYPLATPTDTKITDATLVGQLEALGAMRLFIGENNLLVSATGTNLPATLEFSYPTKFATIGAEWEEGGTKGATIVDVNAIDNTYPVWELMGPAVNPTISVLTTNTTLTYNGTITASQKLVIDMFNKTATLNGTSVIGNVSGDFVYMAPGTNRIAYTAGNTDAPDSTIYWQEVVG